jgi:hypothetical protein
MHKQKHFNTYELDWSDIRNTPKVNQERSEYSLGLRFKSGFYHIGSGEHNLRILKMIFNHNDIPSQCRWQEIMPSLYIPTPFYGINRTFVVHSAILCLCILLLSFLFEAQTHFLSLHYIFIPFNLLGNLSSWLQNC